MTIAIREGTRVVHRREKYGLGTVIAIIRDEESRLTIARVQWGYEYGMREHLLHTLVGYVSDY